MKDDTMAKVIHQPQHQEVSEEVEEIARQLSVCADDAENIVRLMRTAFARGEAGRWPRQLFSTITGWDDGPVLERVAAVSGVSVTVLMEMYKDHHQKGLVARGEATQSDIRWLIEASL